MAKMLTRACEKARKLVADNLHLWESQDPDKDDRKVYLEEVKNGPPVTEYPAWHQAALGAARELESFDFFQAKVLSDGPFDQVQQTERNDRQDG